MNPSKMGWYARSWCTALLLLLCTARGLPGQVAFGNDTASAQPLALSISGGISLGSYQAGVNFGLLELYRHAAWNPEFREATRIPLYQLRSVTGASAGNINTLLWAVEACTDLRPETGEYTTGDPQQSLFWRVWTAIGWQDLFIKDGADLALFDRNRLIDSVARPVLEKRMASPHLVAGCEVPAGITLTRIRPDTLHLQGLPIETQRYVTAFRLTVDESREAAGSRVRFEQIDALANQDQEFGTLVRLEPHEEDIPLSTLLSAVKASAAFPIAFAPVELHVWHVGKQRTQSDLFVDGGVFDNNPVGLARNLYAQTAGGGAGETLDILYVNPGRYRSELAKRRTQATTPISPGGTAAVQQLLGGAVRTARQYELQLLARERRHRLREDSLTRDLQMLREEFDLLAARTALEGDPAFSPADAPVRASARIVPIREPSLRDSLRLSSRAYPIFGEHLSAFASFLGRPAREFDFYAGIYDGYYMAAWEHTCGHIPSSTGEGRAQRHACAGEQVARWIRDPRLVPDPGRQVLISLYDEEFRTSGDRLAHDGSLALPPSAPDSVREKVVVLRGIFHALGSQYAVPDREECTDPRIVINLLCTDGIGSVLASLKGQEEAWSIIRTWAKECKPPEPCRVEPVFAELIENPMTASTRLADALLERMRRVEQGIREDATRENDDNLGAVTAAQWAYHSTHLRSRRLRDPRPTSVPDDKRSVLSFISYVGANLGSSGYEARWQPTVNMTTHWGFHGSALAHWNNEPERSDEKLYFGLGGGPARYFHEVYLSEMGLEYHALSSLSGVTVHELEAYTVLLAGRLRVGLRWLPDPQDVGYLHGDSRWAVSVGLSDPMGLLFWIRRLSE